LGRISPLGTIRKCTHLLFPPTTRPQGGGSLFDSVARPPHRLTCQLPWREPLLSEQPGWQNPCYESLIDSICRELLALVMVLGERHLHRLLSSYFACYRRARPHMGLGHHAPEPRAVEPPQHGRLVTEPMVVGLHHCYRRCAQGEEPCTLLAVWASRSASAPGRSNTPWGMIESRGPTIAGKPSQRRPPPRICRSLYHPSGMKTLLERVRALFARGNGRLKEAKIRCQPGCILMGRPRVRSDKLDARGDP